MTSDPYGDILEDRTRRSARGPGQLAESYKKIAVGPGVPLLHRSTGLRGRVWKFTGELVVLEDSRGGRHTFENHPGSFAYQGETVTIVQKPRSATPKEPATRRSAAGGVVSTTTVARVAQPSRLWVEGDHDARFMERVWGDELRELGIVVEPMGGIDHLVAAVAEFDPRPERRLAILVDHLVPGSKETRLTERVVGPDVLVVGHPYVDIWQCVRPKALGIESWPTVPMGEEWKAGICRRLGWGTTREGWQRVLSAVDSFADLEPELVGSVERALDMLAPPEPGEH